VYHSGGYLKHGSEWGSHVWGERQSWQWQPTLDTHDPTPPITLEGAAGGVTGTLAGTITPTGAISAAHGVSGTLAGTLTPTGAASAAHGVSGTMAGTITPTGAVVAEFGCFSVGWGADVRSDGTKGALDGDDFAGIDGSSSQWRWAQKFDVSSIVGTVTAVELTLNVAVVLGSPTTWDVGPYGTAGTDDPEADSGATMYTRCANAGTYLDNSTAFTSTGLKVLDLGAQAVTDLQAALAGGIFSVSCRYNGAGTGVGASIEEYSGGSAPARLCVTYTDDVAVTGTLAGTLTPTGSIAAAHGVSGALAGTVTPTGAIAAAHGAAATLAGTLTPTGAVAALHGVSGTLAGTVQPTGAIAAHFGADVEGTLAGTLTPTGAVAAAHGVSSTLAGTLAPTGAVAAAHGVSGALAGSVQPTGAIQATHGATTVTGTLAGVIVPTGSIAARFQSSRAAAVKHYQAAEIPDPPKRPRRARKRIELEQQQPEGTWEMPAPQVVPLPDLALELPELRPLAAPLLPQVQAEPTPAPVIGTMAGTIRPSGRVAVLFVHPDYAAQARLEDQMLLLGTL
jgi:hypothetical protein